MRLLPTCLPHGEADAWEIHKKYSNDSYEEFLKKNPVPNDNEIIKNSFKNYGFEIISDSKNNTVGVDY
jgi:hypothetical protein